MSISATIISILAGSYAFINSWGYIGIFLTSLITSAVVLPFPGFIMVFSFASVLNPFVLAFAAALGGAIGSLTSYLIGLGGKELLEKKYENKITKMRKTFKKYGSFLWIIVANLTPIPDNLMSAFCGIIRYDFKRYFLAMFIGKFIFALLISLAGYYSINWVVDYFNLESYFATLVV